MRVERNWEPWETAWLVQNAHRVPLEEAAAKLGRSEQSVKAKAKRLRACGRDVGPLRRCGKVPVVCRSCGEPRYHVDRFGTCRACAADAVAARTRERTAALRGAMPPEVASRRVQEPECGRPPEPDPRDRAAHEGWEAACAKRRARAWRKLYERVRQDYEDFVNGEKD